MTPIPWGDLHNSNWGFISAWAITNIKPHSRNPVTEGCEGWHKTQRSRIAAFRSDFIRGGLMVPRGRVELPTPAFSGPRSTGELPRHRHNLRFYGKPGVLER